MYKRTLLMLMLMLFLWISTCHSVYWDASVGSWHIHRQSETLSFQMEDLCIGNISAIDASGRQIDGYHSRYFHVNLNDVSISDSTGALEGNISSQNFVSVESEAEEDIIREISKPQGSPIYTFEFTEIWPVVIRSDRAIIYNGSGITERDIIYNNRDYASTSLYHSRELSKIRMSDLVLERMNVTVLADEEDYHKVEFLPNRYLGYGIDAYSTGIADLSYRQASPDMIRTTNEGDERYYGSYSLRAGVKMGTIHKWLHLDDDWLNLSCNNRSSVSLKSEVFG